MQTFNTLPPGHSLTDALRTEGRNVTTWLRRQTRNSLAAHEGVEQSRWFKTMVSMSGNDGPEKSAGLCALCAMSIDEAAQAVEALPQDYEELIRLLQTPDPDSGPALQEFMERVRAGRSATALSSIILPSLGALQRKESEAQVMRAMLLAAIEARLSHGGRDALLQSHDPFDDGAPFQVREVEGGFEMQSKLTRNSDAKAVTLRCAW